MALDHDVFFELAQALSAGDSYRLIAHSSPAADERSGQKIACTPPVSSVSDADLSGCLTALLTHGGTRRRQ